MLIQAPLFLTLIALWCKLIVHISQSGLRWFSIGGISEEHIFGITIFKLGLNGERYELVGEYWKW